MNPRMSQNVDIYFYCRKPFTVAKKHFFFSIYFTNFSSSFLSTFIYPSDLNFGKLLFLLKNKIRSIEKMNICIINIKNGIHCNEICIQEGLQPNVTNIYIYVKIWENPSVRHVWRSTTRIVQHYNTSHMSSHIPLILL